MAIVFTGSKTCSVTLAPHLPASLLTTNLAIAPENMTVGQLRQLLDACARVKGGGNENAVVGTLLT